MFFMHCTMLNQLNNKHKLLTLLMICFLSLVIYYFYGRSLLEHSVLKMYTDSKQDAHHAEILSNEQLSKIAKMDKFHLLKFNVFKNHIFVYLHIQKTGGTTMERILVRDLYNLTCKCKKLANKKLFCNCNRRNREPWIICRYTQIARHNWPCGLHADWTELNACVPKLIDNVYGENSERKFFFISQLREPTTRLISEFRNIQRGATWKGSNHICKGQTPNEEDIYCYDGGIWDHVTFDEFITCEKNLALNRQTRMLSNLELVDCYNYSAMSKQRRDNIMLQSAMKNLLSMPYFGLLEYPAESQFLFEKTFGLKFQKEWMLLEVGYASVYMKNFSKADLTKVKEVNYLDIMLYKFAKIVFGQRLKYIKKLFKVSPLETKISKTHKELEVLQRNWKRKHKKNEKKARRNFN